MKADVTAPAAAQRDEWLFVLDICFYALWIILDVFLLNVSGCLNATWTHSETVN